MEAERWVAVGKQQERVRVDSQAPPANSDHEIEKGPRIASSDQNREPGDHHRHNRGEPQHQQHDVVRNRQQPLHEWQPAIQVSIDVGVLDLEMDCLLVNR